MQLTPEQQEIIDFTKNSNANLKINAYAGTGKTTTLVEIAKANPDKKFLYLAFNRAVKEVAQRKFPSNCAVFTLHGLAYRMLAMDYFGPTLNSRLSNWWKNQDYVAYLDAKRIGNLTKSKLTYAARRTLVRFKQSSDMTILAKHIDPEHAMDLNGISEAEVIRMAKKLWNEETIPGHQLPLDHDTYLKCFQMSRPSLDMYDVILVDEAQDINPVMFSILNDFKARTILVGDSFQAIYQWRGAVNAMKKLNESYEEKWLTKSFRFGEGIANLSTDILKMLDPKTPKLIGASPTPAKLKEVEDLQPHTILFRTNAELARTALTLINKDLAVYVEGGVENLCDDLTDLYLLYTNKRTTGKSMRYKIFKTFSEVELEAEHSRDIAKDLTLLKDFEHKLPDAVSTLRRAVKSTVHGQHIDRILSTAHKAKGLEWPAVKLHDDFAFLSKNVEEWNLIYVAITRSQEVLEVPSLIYPGLRFFKETDPEKLDEIKYGTKKEKDVHA